MGVIRRECSIRSREPVRETVVEEAAAAQETAEKAKVELRKEKRNKRGCETTGRKSGDCTGK